MLGKTRSREVIYGNDIPPVISLIDDDGEQSDQIMMAMIAAEIEYEKRKEGRFNLEELYDCSVRNAGNCFE